MFGILWLASYAFVVIGLSVYGLHRLWMVRTYLKYRHLKPLPMARFGQLPKVTVQLPIYNERYVAERLIRSVCALDYPSDLLQIQVLDDSTDETSGLVAGLVREYQGRGLDIEHLTRKDRSGFKAGALQEGMKQAKGEFIAIFDADFVPPPEMLRQTIDFFTDPAVGMIQTRWGHLNRGYNLLTRVQALLLDGHLIIEQTARSRSGRFFNFNGTAGIWRASTIADSGGWQHDTLTEDLDLSYRAQLQGWKFVFVPDLVTPAELPVDMNAFKAQQYRWAKGAVQTCKKLLPAVWRSRQPLRVKLEATFHLTSNFAYLLLACMALLVHPDLKHQGVHWQSVLLIDLPIFMAASLSIFLFYAAALRAGGVSWIQIVFYIPMLIAVGIGLCLNNARAVLEAVFNHHSEFTRTPKYGVSERWTTWWRMNYRSARTVLPWLELLLAAYYLTFVWYAVQHRQWWSLPFFCLFAFGFGYSGWLSIFQGSFFSHLGERLRVGIATRYGV
ncbi:MAG: glycosyltransferase family 2 protein [Candidatus Methylacidiphilales bacterium]|nr:glycosyltransferase family 2 protein [Candidatus Methylacidiphilales bacterium]